MAGALHYRTSEIYDMFVYFDMAIGWGELLKRTYKDSLADDALGLAAQLAYYFFLALFPAILCVLAVASFFPLHNFTDEVISSLARFAPQEMLTLVREQMLRLAEGNNGGILSVGLLGAVWSSSAAMVAIINAMNKAYDIEESRPWWKVRIIAILLTIGLALFIVLSFGLIIGGPHLAEWLAAEYALSGMFVWAWKILQWPVALALVVTGIGLIYYFAPDAEQDWAWITPGSLIATVMWFLGSLAFRYYVVNFGSYQSTYGTVTGVMLLLLWFYLTGLVVVLGAEVSAEIEHASEWGKAPGEKVPGQKKKLGSAAAREFKERASHPTTVTPPPQENPANVYGLPQPTFFERLGTLALLLMVWRQRAKE
jgi:membrane protein